MSSEQDNSGSQGWNSDTEGQEVKAFSSDVSLGSVKQEDTGDSFSLQTAMEQVKQPLEITEASEEDVRLTPNGRQSREKTLSRRALARMYREKGPLPEETVLWMEAIRPTLRSQCRNSPRPCPHVSCRYHLYLDVNPETGSIKLNFPGIEVWEMKESCALDIAERGGVTLEEVGQLMNLTRERIRQLESFALNQVRTVIAERDLTEDLADFETDKN